MSIIDRDGEGRAIDLCVVVYHLLQIKRFQTIPHHGNGQYAAGVTDIKATVSTFTQPAAITKFGFVFTVFVIGDEHKAALRKASTALFTTVSQSVIRG